VNTKKIYITGLGTISAAGENVEQSMESLYAGRRNPMPPQNIKVMLETEYPVFEVFTKKALADKNTTRTTQLALIALEEALAASGLSKNDLAGKRVGIAMGTTVGSTVNSEPFYREYKAGQNPGLQPIHRYLDNNLANYIAEKYDFYGPQTTLVNACSSGTDAIGLAKSWLEQDLCDIAIAGGSDELSRITYLGFVSLLISSSKACRPFDVNREGLNLGEGAGIIILEKEKSCLSRNTRRLAELSAYGTFADAYHPTAPHPEGIGLKRALAFAMHQAGVKAEEIDLINAHGTSTSNNDQVEGKVIYELFRKDLPVVSTKAYTGHTLGAAGGIEAVFTVQALLDQKLPATLGFETFDSECHITPTIKNIELDANVALSNSLAFGGNNSTLIFRRVE